MPKRLFAIAIGCLAGLGCGSSSDTTASNATPGGGGSDAGDLVDAAGETSDDGSAGAAGWPDDGGGGAAGEAGGAGGAGANDGGGDAGGQPCTAGAASCVSASKLAICNDSGTGVASFYDCPAGTTCDRSGCTGALPWHLARSVHLQYVQSYPADQLLACGASAADDVAAGRVGCDARRSSAELDARFGLFLGNTWLTFPDGPSQCASSADPAAWRACVADNLALVISRFHALAPDMLAAAHLAEYVHEKNVPQSWPGLCVSGSVGHWGPDTCIPDVAGSAAARQYLADWAKAYIDAGVRAFVFGQARLTGGSAVGSDEVSAAGAAGFKSLIDELRAYAKASGIPHLYIGAQAADSIAVGGVEQVDFVMGAQHLEPSNGWLLQPLGAKGPFVASSTPYGPDDWHDANIGNDKSRLPVLLDYDNWSSDPAVPDDIRRLAQVANDAERGRVLKDHVRHLHLYAPTAWLSIPVSKTLGNATGATCTGVSQWQFSASACGLVAAAKQALDSVDDPPTDGAAATDPPIRRTYWGQQLRGRDATVSWLYQVFLNWVPDAATYASRVASLPALVDTACGARASFAKTLVASSEFTTKGVSDAAFVDMLFHAFLLREPDTSGKAWWVSQLGTKSRAQIIDLFCGTNEANALYAAP